LPGSLLMARLRAFLQLQERAVFDDVRELASKANELFCCSSRPYEFASLFFGRYDERSRRLTYVNCGQVPRLLIRRDGSVQKLGVTAPAMGIGELECRL
jgi:serine phosphatase RsbU (regulator of sigma subunit)